VIRRTTRTTNQPGAGEAGSPGPGQARQFRLPGRFGWFVFPTHGITPLGYAAFGFALGVTAGLLARRPVPAISIDQ
jgi:hypothetical protein